MNFVNSIRMNSDNDVSLIQGDNHCVIESGQTFYLPPVARFILKI